tara:strand:- start:1510 stop:1803 length:294 start_codon:yes stop_codon:yes gene_type:complete
MRQITTRAFSAFRANQDFSLDNTRVTSDENQTSMYLHGNCIARKCRKSGMVEITTAGWNTPTTKERLKPFAGVHTIKHELHLEGLPWTGDWTVIGGE